MQTANTSSYQILGSSAFFMNDIIEARKTGVNSLEIGRFLCILFQYSEVPKNSFRNVKLSCLRTALLPMEVLVHHTTLAGPPVSQMNFPFPFLGEVSLLSIALNQEIREFGDLPISADPQFEGKTAFQT